MHTKKVSRKVIFLLFFGVWSQMRSRVAPKTPPSGFWCHFGVILGAFGCHFCVLFRASGTLGDRASSSPPPPPPPLFFFLFFLLLLFLFVFVFFSCFGFCFCFCFCFCFLFLFLFLLLLLPCALCLLPSVLSLLSSVFCYLSSVFCFCYSSSYPQGQILSNFVQTMCAEVYFCDVLLGLLNPHAPRCFRGASRCSRTLPEFSSV